MKNYFLKSIIKIFFIIVCLQNICLAQDGKPVKLLGKWLGDWKGTLEMNYFSGRKKSNSMELKIHETDTAGVWTWEIIYGEGEKKEVRNYLLRKIDSEKGQYILDEKNSILIDFFCSEFKAFYNTFSVASSLIITKYELIGNKIYFELIFSNLNVPKITGEPGKDTTNVYSYPVGVVQKAELIKN